MHDPHAVQDTLIQEYLTRLLAQLTSFTTLVVGIDTRWISVPVLANSGATIGVVPAVHTLAALFQALTNDTTPYILLHSGSQALILIPVGDGIVVGGLITPPTNIMLRALDLYYAARQISALLVPNDE